MESTNSIKKGLVISGGGARGAWGVGVAKALSLHENNTYTVAAGASTGNLMCPLLLLRDFDRLEKAYMSVKQSDIFNVSPFKSDGEINYLKVGWRMVTGKKTLGESKALLKLIKSFVTEDDFNNIKSQGLEFGAAVTNITEYAAELKLASKNEYADMVEWMWASANTPALMSLLHKDGYAWVDGGFTDTLPISWVIDSDCDEVDVIVHKTEHLISDHFVQTKGALQLLFRTIQMLVANVARYDITLSKVNGKLEKDITINYYYMTEDQVNVTKNPLVFNSEVMTNLLNEGYQSVVDGSVIKKSFVVDRQGNVVGK